MDLEVPHQPAPLALQFRALKGAGHALQRDRSGRVFADFRFGDEAVRNVAILSREISGGE
ncbi:MAG: hypothetical protein AUJ01_12155 [Acidobacteria bacterium 13_1_40CM_3_65_5]|nr:MAG: hypothetical protein AUJ01_12155 [Acidobacteria bacterium 13_1_40CM_3_65_5]